MPTTNPESTNSKLQKRKQTISGLCSKKIQDFIVENEQDNRLGGTSRGHKRWIFVDKIGEFFVDTFLIVMKRVAHIKQQPNLTQT